MEPRDPHDEEAESLRAAGGDRDARLGELVDVHRRRLLKMVHLRMDPRLKARLGASDVLQEVYVDVVRRIDGYLDGPDMPFFLWLRILTGQKIVDLHRRHLRQKRDVRRQAAARVPHPEASSIALVDHLMATSTTPSRAAVRHELRERAITALDDLKPEDRAILVLRHFEELSNGEAATELGIEKAAASKRYVRALRRMGSILEEIAGSDAP